MKCAIHQPQFLPWLGYLHKIYNVDKFVFLDNVQFRKNEFQNRNRILVAGTLRWLTVPVSFKFGDTLREVAIAATVPWRKKMLNTLDLNYAKAAYFRPFQEGLARVLEREWDNLAELNQATVQWLMACFDIRTEVYISSQLVMPQSRGDKERNSVPVGAVLSAAGGLPEPGQGSAYGGAQPAQTGVASDAPTQRLIDLCRRVGADTYLSGTGGHQYLESAEFEKAGIHLEFQEFQHPVYPQYSLKEGDAFVPCCSAIDGLFHCGGGAAGRKRLGIEPL